jgi:DNA-binding CsgD family transcriptional regulator
LSFKPTAADVRSELVCRDREVGFLAERRRDGALLSPREREVGELVAQGHSNDEIAQILHISLRTAEKHVSSALRKLNLRSRVQLGRLLARSQTNLESSLKG